MKTSFADADSSFASPEAQSTTPVASTAVATRPPQELVPDSFFNNDNVEGGFDKDDLKIPRLNLVQSVGPLSGELGFKPGAFVYNKEADLGSGPIKITLLKLRKYFLEDLPYGSETFPRLFKSAEEAAAAGFLDIRQKREMGEEHKYVKPVLDADVLIEGKADEATFPLDFNGTPYAMARWTLQSTAYSRVGKGFFTDSQLALRAGLSTKFYTISTKREKLGNNFVWVPRAQLSGRNSDEFIAWIKDVVG